MLGSKLEADEDLAGTSRVLPLRPSASVWDVLVGRRVRGRGGDVACGGRRERHVSRGPTHTHKQTYTHTKIKKYYKL